MSTGSATAWLDLGGMKESIWEYLVPEWIDCRLEPGVTSTIRMTFGKYSIHPFILSFNHLHISP